MIRRRNCISRRQERHEHENEHRNEHDHGGNQIPVPIPTHRPRYGLAAITGLALTATMAISGANTGAGADAFTVPLPVHSTSRMQSNAFGQTQIQHRHHPRLALDSSIVKGSSIVAFMSFRPDEDESRGYGNSDGISGDEEDGTNETAQRQSPTTDDLYEFLTRRQQQLSGRGRGNENTSTGNVGAGYPNRYGTQDESDAERVRKRDRIFPWMSTNNSPTQASKAKVQPISIDDQADSEDTKDSTDDANEDTPKVVATSFDSLFEGMPSLDDILTAGGAASVEEERDPTAKLPLPNMSDDNNSKDGDIPTQSQQQQQQQKDDSWFHKEEQGIRKDYATIQDEMKQSIRNERNQNQHLQQQQGQEQQLDQTLPTSPANLDAALDVLLEPSREDVSSPLGRDGGADASKTPSFDADMKDDEKQFSIPDNAEGIVDSIIQQELDRTLKSEKRKMAMERLQEYERLLEEEMELTFIGADETTDIAESILKEAEQEYDRNLHMQQQYDEFQEYYATQQQQQQHDDGAPAKAANNSSSSPSSAAGASSTSSPTSATSSTVPAIPSETQDLDEWALQSLEEMLAKRSQSTDMDASDTNSNGNGSSSGNSYETGYYVSAMATSTGASASTGQADSEDDVDETAVSDILEDTIEELRSQIDKEANKGTIRPETMKEWQMYRSIATATRSNAKDTEGQTGGGGGVTNLSANTVDSDDEAEIAAKLESWKRYVSEEEKSRQLFGLSSEQNPKMPFEWHEPPRKSVIPPLSRGSATSETAQDANADGASTPTSTSTPAWKAPSQADPDMNQQAIVALRDLISKTTDPSRITKLQSEIDYLQSAIDNREPEDNEGADQVKDVQPVDFSDVFGQSSDDATDDDSRYDNKPSQPIQTISPPSWSFPSADEGRVGANDDGVSSRDPEMPTTVSSTPPNTPFFQDDLQQTPMEATVPQPSATRPPPNTPFFQEDEVTYEYEGDSTESLIEDGTAPIEDDELAVSKLGTLEEQKLRAMYRRAGAKTTEEKEELKAQWQAFQQFETERRQMSGLSSTDRSDESGDGERSTSSNGGIGVDDANTDLPTNLKYDISEVVSEDGDVDADKILASIGPRPSRTKRDSAAGLEASAAAAIASQAPAQAQAQANQDDTSSVDLTSASSGASDDSDTTYVPSTELDAAEVSESLYRSISAVGGGRVKDDPSLKEEQKADFEAYMAKEAEMRKQLDSADNTADGQQQEQQQQQAIDVDQYAKDALQSLGPRPTFVRRKTTAEAGEYSDRGGILSNNEIEDDDDEDEEDNSDADNDVGDASIPEWLRKEQETGRIASGGSSGADQSTNANDNTFQGRDMDDVFDDDKYDHNMRQLAEYQRRRSGQKGGGGLGIDINVALGRGRGTDDYADYSYDTEYFRGRNNEWGMTSFEARKRHLLEYTELSTIEVSNLIDHKTSVYATGVSQYMPRINKPFQEFGAILRLEGVIVDLTGLSYRAWTAVAKKFAVRLPTVEDARRASVVQSEVAVRDVFYWTKDLLESREIAQEHDLQFQLLFDEWAEQNGIEKPVDDASNASASAANTNDINPIAMGAAELGSGHSTAARANPAMNEQERLSIVKHAWEATANKYGFPNPPFDLIVQSTAMSPDIAVQTMFGWSADPNQVDRIVAAYRHFMQQLREQRSNGNDHGRKPVSGSGSDLPLGAPVNVSTRLEAINENDMLEIQFVAWSELAKEIGQPEPEPEAVLAAAVLNDAAIVIMDGFGWTDDAVKAQELAHRYQSKLTEIINTKVHGRAHELVDRETGGVGLNTALPSPDQAATKQPGKHSSQQAQAQKQQLEALLDAQASAWATTAAKHGFDSPSIDQIELTMRMQPDESVRRLLAWTHNFNDEQIRTISSTYEEALNGIAASESSKPLMDAAASSRANGAQGTASTASTEPSTDELFKVAFDAWTEVAWKRGYAMPSNEDVLFALTVGPEEAILNGFGWADDMEQSLQIAQEYRDQITSKRSRWKDASSQGSSFGAGRNGDGEGIRDDAADIPAVAPVAGIHQWIKSLLDVEMGCGITSHLTRDQALMLLDFAGLQNVIPPEHCVTADDNYDRDSQQLLGAALRMERRPDQCTVFDTTPNAALAGQDVEMRTVAFVGTYPRYDLLAADATAVSFSELTAMNIRRLFGERVYDQPQLDMVQAQPAPKRKVLTRFWDDE